MERVTKAKEPAQSARTSALCRSPSPSGPAVDHLAQAKTTASDSGSPRFVHHPSRFTIFPGGAPGPVPYRASMERSFAADLSGVRTYSGSSALFPDSGARAAAWPETVVFASPHPSPRIVAHEVAHILQYRHAASFPWEGGKPTANRQEAEQEAEQAANAFRTGAPVRIRASPAIAPLYFTDQGEIDPATFAEEHPPQFAGREVGTWGNTWPASLIAGERLAVNVPESERSHAIVEAIARREPIVILHEQGRLWLYRLQWEGLSGRYSRFTNADTLFHAGTEQPGNYSVSNVQGQPEVEAFVTEDGGVLSPPGAGKLFSHTGGEIEDPLVSTFQNASAFLRGMGQGLEGAGFASLSARLRRMAAFNTVFPTPFAIGAVRGLADQMLDYVQLLNPQRWAAMEERNWLRPSAKTSDGVRRPLSMPWSRRVCRFSPTRSANWLDRQLSNSCSHWSALKSVRLRCFNNGSRR